MSKSPQDSATESVFLARPGNANTIGTVFGGDLMQMMDEIAAICARRHSGLRVATVAVNDVQFNRPLLVGQVIRLNATAARVFKTSMMVLVTIHAEDTFQQESFLAATAWFTIVCMNEQHIPAEIPELEPITLEHKELWSKAGQLREK